MRISGECARDTIEQQCSTAQSKLKRYTWAIKRVTWNAALISCWKNWHRNSLIWQSIDKLLCGQIRKADIKTNSSPKCLNILSEKVNVPSDLVLFHYIDFVRRNESSLIIPAIVIIHFDATFFFDATISVIGFDAVIRPF